MQACAYETRLVCRQQDTNSEVNLQQDRLLLLLLVATAVPSYSQIYFGPIIWCIVYAMWTQFKYVRNYVKCLITEHRKRLPKQFLANNFTCQLIKNASNYNWLKRDRDKHAAANRKRATECENETRQNETGRDETRRELISRLWSFHLSIETAYEHIA